MWKLLRCREIAGGREGEKDRMKEREGVCVRERERESVCVRARACVCVRVRARACVRERRKIELTAWGKKVPIPLDGIRTCTFGMRPSCFRLHHESRHPSRLSKQTLQTLIRQLHRETQSCITKHSNSYLHVCMYVWGVWVCVHARVHVSQSWEVPDWDARSARAQSMTLGVVTMVTSIKNGVPYVCFSCHTWSSNGPFIAFLPFKRFHSGYLASRMDTGSSSCDGGSERHSFCERQSAESLQLGKNQAVLEHADPCRVNVPIHNLPVKSTTSDFSSFGRRSSAFRQPRQILFTWHPMMAVKTLSTQEGTAGCLGLQSDKLQREWNVLSHTKTA